MFFSAQVAFAFTMTLFSLQADARPHHRRSSGDMTLDQLSTILGNKTCTDSKFPEECRTAEQALPFINQAFYDFGIDTIGEQAALLSLMEFESGGFQFNINHFPGRPGQGTRNMMTFPFIYQYAVDTPSLSQQAIDLAGTDPSSPSITNSTMNEVRALVLPDDYSFASAAWFYKRSGEAKVGCTGDAGLVEGLQSATEEGWSNYITKCVFTTVTDDRKQSWETALNALLN